MDGFPRTLSQAEALGEILSRLGSSLDHVVNLNVDRGLLMARLTGRRICSVCGTSYHLIFQPAEARGHL
ncbi:adenylate kinase family protein [Paenibacillus rhizoplanae]